MALISPPALRVPGKTTACRTSATVTGTGERFDPDLVWIPRVEREDLMPRALVPDPWPVDTDLLHCFSSPGPAAIFKRGRWQPGLASLALRERYLSGPP